MSHAFASPPPTGLPHGARRVAWLLIAMAALLAVLGLFAITALSAARAYVAGESQWSRAQKGAALALVLYLQSGDEAQYQAFEREIAVPLNARRAREAMDRGGDHDDEARQGFIASRNHADDAPGMIRLYRCCRGLPYMAESVGIWREADELITELTALARQARELPPAARAALLPRVLALDARLTPMEQRFSASLGLASRITAAALIGMLVISALLFGLAAAGLVMRRAREDLSAHQAVQRSEALFRSLWETSIDGAVIIDAASTIRFANPAVHALLGHEAGSLAGRPLATLQPQGLQAPHAAGLARHLATGEKRLNWRGVETLARHADGHELPVEIRFSRFELDGEALFVGLLHDISERKAAERATAEHLRLQEADRLKSEFLARMSHELRTPLNAILGFTDLMHSGRSGPVTAEQKRQLGFVASSGRHLLALINDLLELSRIESGRMDLHIEPIDIAQIAADVAGQLRPLAEPKGLALQLDTPPSLPWRGDRRKLTQVLLNLVGNAIKFSAQGDIRIRAWQDAGRLLLSVRDHGPGIPEEHRALLFQPFRQLEGGVAHAQEGTGLGLYLSAQLLAGMQGRIRHEPAEGGGSCFIIDMEALP
ncbi:PAS domain S-box-containing protein [Pelomonas saccharophila]|uniref:histidine kinase n=1 Tax=Roseateles saccharophilus TaxID=304 RepID=A0ABU1YMC5_ROSSA|nr:ATP-binding protein [Roseateles saccharophilus]MDR7269893.1 PAS domain S-box-containing protein [Roseateles saccharophilus]